MLLTENDAKTIMLYKGHIKQLCNKSKLDPENANKFLACQKIDVTMVVSFMFLLYKV
jgi:hypothetical protein